ncbi:FG-GAP-like repeat-containing protein [Thiobacillus sp.]|uniref:FG-GAP-like repeat-containing protein n=1 Tax=Thiobacillus sp. TaxID=924 RepID=UPI0017DA736F|nr:FG-GAP-like repeat-containing protein [Thiobacillus sp.]MBC2732657.1 hypothetical protein [Thiobacillus sp.]MBC2741394.1 VCBS repeat-containing protein [Thiobacillus sp.]MBC2759014.1 VCBS repeat-containing protein [Thiobacillus sp.]
MSFSFAVYRPSPGRVFERIIALFGLIVFILTSFAPSAYATAVGATPGSHQVSPSGAFTYTIPIAVPPGTAGIEPKLSLSYNSQGGNGLLGMGWSLAGLSVIHRCPKTMVQDGVIGGVNYNANDRYCLDGQRLVAVSGTYGADATEYRTESESYSRIVSYGSQGSGPGWWKVWTKSGQILEYGNTADSRIEAQGKTEVMLWSLNKLSDTVGNYLTVSYIEDNPSGQYYPDRIDYTGNGNAGKTPGNSVRFMYETRPDVTPLYQAGSVNKTTVRLTNVQTFAGNALVKDYRLAYDTLGSAGRSRLVTLSECDSLGNCLFPTTLDWKTLTVADGNFTAQGSGNWIGHANGAAQTLVGDFDGNGKDDLLGYSVNGIVSISPFNVCTSNGSSYSCSTWNAGSLIAPILGDFNADGKADVAGYAVVLVGNPLSPSRYFAYHALVCLNTGSSFTCSTWAPSVLLNGDTSLINDRIIGDFNGDGRSDWALWQPNSQWKICTSTGTSFSCSIWSGPTVSINNTVAGDFNGDGKTDLAGYTSNGSWNVCLSTGSGFSCSTWLGHSGGASNNVVADFNGDGLTDLAQYVSGTIWNVCLSTGVGFTCDNWSGVSATSADTKVGDFNGDGKSDIAASLGSASWNVCLSSGTAFTCGIWSGSNATTANTKVGDFNGDGKTDLTGYVSGSTWHTTLSGGEFPDTISSATTGLGTSTTVTYKPLTDSSVYTKDAGAVYPYVDVQSPLYVVSSVATSDGIGGTYSTYYSYAGAKSHLLGGGFLGFRQVTLRDYQADMYSVTTYRQDYPYQGQPLSTQKRTNGGVLLSQSLITYTDQLLNTGISPTWHQSLPTHTVESSYELTGGLISIVVTDTQYDAWGNPTHITIDSGGGYNKTTTNTYDNIIDANRWFLGRLRRSTVTSVTP